MCDICTPANDLVETSGPFEKDVSNTSGQLTWFKLESLLIVSYNTQKSWSNITALLETHKATNVVMIQEMPWANYKWVASAINKEGDIIISTVRHRSFTCMGDSPTSAVCFYVNKHLSHCSPVLENVIGLETNNILLLNLLIDDEGTQIRLMNVYNHPKDMKAVRTIMDYEDMLPHINLCMGDFNMRHPLWNPQGVNNKPSPLAQDLIGTLQSHLNLCLVNAPDNVCTWSSNNSKLNNQVLDLAWVEKSRACEAKLDMDINGRFNSDHAILLLTLPYAIIAPQARPTIKRGSKTGCLFLADLRKLFSTLPETYNSYDEIQEISYKLYRDLDRVWLKHATNPRPLCYSTLW
jgi:hypothetical protein